MPDHQLTEQDLNNLIDQKLLSCDNYPNVCRMLSTGEGKKRVKERIKELIFKDGITNIDTAIADVETELIWGE